MVKEGFQVSWDRARPDQTRKQRIQDGEEKEEKKKKKNMPVGVRRKEERGMAKAKKGRTAFKTSTSGNNGVSSGDRKGREGNEEGRMKMRVKPSRRGFRSLSHRESLGRKRGMYRNWVRWKGVEEG